MIEPNLVKWVDLGDSMQKSEIYIQRKMLIIFRLFRTMLQNQTGNIIFIILLKLVFYIQVMMIPIINNSPDEGKKDSLIKFLNYIKQIIFIQNLIKKKTDYNIFLGIGYFLTIILYILVLYILIKTKEKVNETPIRILNVFNLLLQNYLLCPIINIFMLSIKCKNSKHIFLNIKCFEGQHLIITIFSFFCLFSSLIYSFLLSIFYYQVGGIKSHNFLKRVHCNYELYANFFTSFYYFLSYYLQYYTNEKDKNYQFYNRIAFFVFTLFLFLYNYFYVFYYDRRVNHLNLYGWGFLWWYSVGLLLKNIFNVNDISLFFIIGIVALSIILFFVEEYNIEYYLTETNILEAKSVKNIEIFTYHLLDNVVKNSVFSKTLVKGIINSIEEFFQTQPELFEKYDNFVKNKIMIRKLGGKKNIIFNIYNIIYVVYDFYLDKAEMKDQIMIILCYFLLNHLKNGTYAGYLVSTIKVNGILTLYFKYLLVEDIKDFLISKLKKNSASKDSIKHIEIGSVIVYDNYTDSFKMKIYDAACNQIDYFDILKNNTLTPKATKNFLNTGDTILKLRTEIHDLWNKIIKLNPFSDEIEKDYMLYLRQIIQDDDLAQKEEKKYYHIKMSKLNEKYNIYHSIFDKEKSSIVLVDGCGIIGKIIYVTPNFGTLYNFLPKELVNVMITDLQPTYVSQFHKDIMIDALKYSNLNYIYTNMINVVMKGKGNGIFNINAYVKCIPNFDYGLIYILAAEKINDEQFIILLDQNFCINAMTNPYYNASGNFIVNNNANCYNLNNNIVGYHCGIIIPDILKLIQYNGEKFVLLKKNIDLKGILYSNNEFCSDIKYYVDSVLDRIKQTQQLIYDENIINNKQNNNQSKFKREQNLHEFYDLVNHLKEKCQDKSYSIFYRIDEKEFLNGKHYFYKVYVSNDLMNSNELNNNSSMKLNVSLKSKSKKSKEENEKEENKKKKKNEIRGIKVKISEDEKNEKVKKELEENNNNENEDNNNIDRQLSQNSFSTKSSADNASFNKLKSRILEKNQPNIIKYMKYISLCFLIVTLFLIYLNSNDAKKKLKYLEQYLDENFYFNHTKITVSCIYATGVNLKFIKNNLLHDETCISTNSCKLIYSELLMGCLDDIKNETAKIAFFDVDYKAIMSSKNNITIYIYNLTSEAKISLDSPNLLNFLLSSGLRFVNFIDDYIHNNESEYQIYGENVINQGLYYINNELIEGFDRSTMDKKITEKRFSNNLLFVIINCIFFTITNIFYIYLIIKLYKIEKYFISKLVKFHPVSFDNYIKYLEDLKKKLRNDSGEDEEKNDEENQSNENNEQHTKDDEKNNRREKRDSKIERNINKESRHNKKKMQGKMSKIQQQKQEKINVMCKYIFQHNILTAFKIGIILILAMLYYVIVFVLYIKKRKEYFIFDDIINNIYGIYKDCDIIFANILNEANIFGNFDIERNYLIYLLQNKIISKGKLNGEYYTLDNISSLINLTYKMNIPTSNEAAIPKVNNILLPIIANVKMDKSSIKAKLAQLFNGDICDIIFENNQTQYNTCSKFWSSILKQGLIQCITQLSVEINTVLNEMEDVNNGIISFIDFINNSTFSQLETFVNYYFLECFRKNDEYFNIMRKDKLNILHQIVNLLLIIFFIIILILFFILILIIYSLKNMFSSFLGFIGIIPIQYLYEDEFFYKDVLKLEEDIFD